jgi:hypothetical protein
MNKNVGDCISMSRCWRHFPSLPGQKMTAAKYLRIASGVPHSCIGPLILPCRAVKDDPGGPNAG